MRNREELLRVAIAELTESLTRPNTSGRRTEFAEVMLEVIEPKH